MKKKKLRFNDLIKKHSDDWDKIAKLFVRLYPEQKKSINGYKMVFRKLVKMKSKRMMMEINLVFCKDPEDVKPWVRVNGKKSKSEHSWAIEFTPWDKWLGMSIEPLMLYTFSEEEVICHCLWEMTYCGFDQRGIQNTIRGINSRVKKVKKDLCKISF